MKNLLTAVVLDICISSCQYIAGEQTAKDSTNNGGMMMMTESWPTVRDTSIDSTNAYNNLFLDSNAVNIYISSNKISAADSQALRGFYNMRNYQFAWFAKGGMTEQGHSFWNAYTYAKSHGMKDSSTDQSLMARMDTIVEIDTLLIAATDTAFQQNEVALTHRFIKYYRNSDSNSLVRRLPLNQLLPIRKADPIAMADSILQHTNAIANSSHQSFAALLQQLALYDSIAKKGGWQMITGKSGAAITAIKKRMARPAEHVPTGMTPKNGGRLLAAIKSCKERHGLAANEAITDSFINILNLPVEQRIQQILINLNRVAWMPSQVKDNYVAVNIPGFMLEVHEGDSVPVKMEVVVGKEGSNTMMFSGDLNQVVFSPTWNLPESIVRDEIMPAMKKDPNYLKKRNMEIVNKNDSLPQIRQLPGDGNALGKVKFLFPNSYDIYLHDTEAKNLFAKNKRAFSHGCIRLADAETMSEYVLRNDKSWTTKKNKTTNNNGEEQTVDNIKKKPVCITYFTTWVDEEGKLHFRDDVYKHDKRTAAMMFKTNVA